MHVKYGYIMEKVKKLNVINSLGIIKDMRIFT